MKKTDILIVGHGLAGSLMAWELQQLGVDFLVLNAPTIPRSSDVAGGLFNPLMFRRLRLSRMVEELWPVMETTYSAIEEHFNTKLLHQVLSAKVLYNKDILEWEQGQSSNTGPYMQDLKRAFPIKGFKKVPALGFIAASGYLNIPEWLEISKRNLTSQNRYLEEVMDYGNWQISKEKIIANNAIEARKVVFCEGAAVKNNPWFKGDWFTPNKGELLEIRAPGLDENFILRDDLFILPLGNKRFKVGATYSHDTINSMPSEDGRMQLTTKLDKMILDPYELLGHYAGVRPATKDRMPVLGAHKDHENLFIFNGLGSKGVVYAPYCAKVLVESLLFSNELLPELLNFRRFTHLPQKTTN